jgi:nucleoside-diphosphate-sugar epimerase
MKNIIITGANGMIGNLILKNCLKRDDVAKVTTITRKPLDFYHPKLVEIIHTDFLDFSTIENSLIGQDVCFYCVGVYTGQVPTEEFKKITVAYTEVFARALRKNSLNTSFCFLSGQGADSKETSKILFAKEKGIAENILVKLNFKSTHIFRPGYIYPVTKREEPNFFYKLMRWLYAPLKFIYPNVGVTSEKLANTMVDVGMGNTEKAYYENDEIRKY